MAYFFASVSKNLKTCFRPLIKTLKLASDLSYKNLEEICKPKPESTHKYEHNKLVTKQQGNNDPPLTLVMNKSTPK